MADVVEKLINAAVAGDLGAEIGTFNLVYDTDDPLAVRLEAESGDWAFARQLLSDGIVRPTGDGDVRVEPYGTAVLVTLTGEAGGRPARVVLTIDADEIAAFLDATFEVEPEPEDVDAELVLILAGGLR